MDINLLSRNTLKEIRGDKSQEWIARRLGGSKTQIYRWEAGKSKIRWDKFCELCSLRKCNLKLSLKSVVGEHVAATDISKFLFLLLDGKKFQT